MLPKVPRSSWLQHSQDFLTVISKTRRFVVWGTVEYQIPDIDELDKKINQMKRPNTYSIFYAQMSCDSKVITDLTHFRKAGFYDFPAFGVGNKRKLETYIGFFLCEEKSIFPKFPNGGMASWSNIVFMSQLISGLMNLRGSTSRHSCTSKILVRKIMSGV